MEAKKKTVFKIQQKHLAYGAITLTSVIFGFSFLFTKRTLGHLEVFQMLGIRFLTAALCMTLLVVTRVVKVNYNRKKLTGILLVSIVQPVLYFTFETFGVKLISASESGMMIALIPIAVAVFSMFILKEKIAARQWAGIFAAVTGVVLITAAKGFFENVSQFTGYIMLAGAILAAGLYNPLSRKASVQSTPFETTYIMILAGTLVFNGIGLGIAGAEGRLSSYFADALPFDVLQGILYLSLLSSVVAFFCLNYALSKIKSSVSASFANLTTVISVMAGVFLNGENLYWLQLVGALLVLAGIWLVAKTNGARINPENGVSNGL